MRWRQWPVREMAIEAGALGHRNASMGTPAFSVYYATKAAVGHVRSEQRPVERNIHDCLVSSWWQ